jgi:hypothetical protein
MTKGNASTANPGIRVRDSFVIRHSGFVICPLVGYGGPM